MSDCQGGKWQLLYEGTDVYFQMTKQNGEEVFFPTLNSTYIKHFGLFTLFY